MSIDFQKIVVDEEAVASSWRVHDNGGDFADFELKTNMAGGILVERQSSLKWSETKRLGELLIIVALKGLNIASEASYIYILSGQKFIKNSKNGPLLRFFENLKLVVKQCYQKGHFKNDKN